MTYKYNFHRNRVRCELSAIKYSNETARKMADPDWSFSRYLKEFDRHLVVILQGYEWSSLKP